MNRWDYVAVQRGINGFVVKACDLKTGELELYIGTTEQGAGEIVANILKEQGNDYKKIPHSQNNPPTGRGGAGNPVFYD